MLSPLVSVLSFPERGHGAGAVAGGRATRNPCPGFSRRTDRSDTPADGEFVDGGVEVCSGPGQRLVVDRGGTGRGRSSAKAWERTVGSSGVVARQGGRVVTVSC